MVLTVVAMSGVVIAPNVKAAASAGDLIKMDGLSSVYYLGSDGKRYVFPNEATYMSWYSDFSGVVTITASELQSYPIGGNVVMRPGTKLVKITTDPSVYAVEPNGVLRKIQSEAQAAALFGTNWNKRIVDVPDAFFTNYTIGSVLPDGQYPIGTLVKNASSASIYYYDGTNYRMFATEAAFTANRFKMADVLTTSSTLTAGGTSITAAELVNVSQGGSGTVIVSTGSGLMVSLSADTPAAKTIPSQATGAVVAKYNFTAANDGAVVLQGLTVKRTGVGSPSEVSKIYLYDGATRLTSGRTINTSDNTASFSNIGYTIAAGTTKTLSVVVDVADLTSAGNHIFGIESASAVTAGGASVSGSFPMNGNTMTFNTTDVGLTDIENANSYTVKSGATGVEVGRLAVHVNTTEDGQLEALTLYNSGRDILSNLKLYRGSDMVATATQSGSYFTFVLGTPYKINKGESAVFTVKADITNARNADTATLYVRYKTDLKVKGLTYGYYLAPTLAQGSDGSNSAIDELDSSPMSQSITVEAGQVTVTSSGPVAANVAKDTNDVVFMNLAITTVAAVDIEKVGVILKDSDNSDDDDVSNLELVCDGVIMNEWSDPTESSAGSVNTDTSVWSIPANTTKNCQIRMDIESAKTANDTISVDWDYSNWTFKDSNTGDSITDVVPSTDIAGQQMTAVANSLTVTMSSTPTSQTWVSGASFDANAFNFAVGDAGAVKVTEVKLIAALDEDMDGTYGIAGSDNSINTKDVISSVELYNGSTKIGSTETISSAGLVTFDTLAWNLVASANEKLTVKAYSSSNAPYNSDNDYIKFYVSSITAEYGSGSSLSATYTAVDTAAEVTIYQTITSAGTLTAVAAADNPTSALVLMGSTANMTKVKFTSTNEAFVVEKLEVKNTSGTTDDDEYATVSITYPTQTGTETKTQSFVGDTATFSGLNFYIAKDADAYLLLKGTFNTKTAGADDDTTTALDLDYNTNFRAVAQNSGTVKVAIDSLSADVLGNDMYVYESVPTVVFASDTPSGTLIPSVNTLVAKIGITASAAKDITFDSADSDNLSLQVSATGASLAADDDVITIKKADGTTLDTDTINLGTDTQVDFDFSSTALTVAAGTTEYIYVYLDTTELATQGNSVQIWLDDVAADCTFGVNGTGAYARGNIIFKGDLYGGALVKP